MKLVNSKKRIENRKKGFSILELLMVMGIFSILTGVTVFGYGDFNNNIITTNLAYEVALSVRQAQVFSLGVRGSSSNDFNTRYGVFFNKAADGGNPSSFVFFADRDNYGICDNDGDECDISICLAGADNECEQVSSFTRGIEISRICASNSQNLINDSGDCHAGVESIDKATITFTRPNPDANILDAETSDSYQNISIILEATNGSKRAVTVRQSGQISVEFISN